MILQPLEIAELVKPIAWPVVAALAIVVFRKPAAEIVRILGGRLNKISISGISLELAVLSEQRPSSLDSQLRQPVLLPTPSDPSSMLACQLQGGGSRDYILIDLGSKTLPRWLTSRLYLFAVMLEHVGRIRCFVFVETVAEIRSRFVGVATPGDVRWALARRYPWLEYIHAQVVAAAGPPIFDLRTGERDVWQTNNIVAAFLEQIRRPPSSRPGFQILYEPPPPVYAIDIGSGVSEFARWLNGGMVERLLGGNLATSYVQIPPGETIQDLSPVILQGSNRFIAVVEADRRFRQVLDQLGGAT